MAAGNARVNRMNVAPGHQLRFFDRTLNRVHGRFDVHDHAFFQTARWMRANADDLDHAVVIDLANDRNDFGRADIEADDQILVRALGHSAILLKRAFRRPFFRIGHRRSRAVVPADREAVAVAHIDVLDFGGTAGNDVRDDVEKQIRTLINVTAAEPHIDAVVQCHLPGATRIEMHAAQIQATRNQRSRTAR